MNVAMTDDLKAVDALRWQLWENGYRPVAIYHPGAEMFGKPVEKAGKRPTSRDWLKLAQQDPPWVLGRPLAAALSTGIACLEVVGADIDITDPALVDKIAALIEATVGVTPLSRVGRDPKRMLIYRAPEEPFAKLATPRFRLPDGSTAQLEILAHGQQFVAYGIHPDTGKPYRWDDGDPRAVPVRELPVITAMQARDMIGAAAALIEEAGGVDIRPAGSPRATQARSDDFFGKVNDAALADPAAWAPALHPGFRDHGNSGWRVSSKELGRDLEEDFVIHRDGVRDFGEETGLTPIDTVIRFGHAPDAAASALWLCAKLGRDPADLGWKKAGGQVPPDGDPAPLLEPLATPAFPRDFLPGDLGAFAVSQAGDLQVPLDFVAIPLLIAAAAAIGHEFRMAPKSFAAWTERACLWGGCIGHVGDGKTPAFNAALAPVWPLQAKWREDYSTATRTHNVAAKLARALAKQWEKAVGAALKAGDEPPPMPQGAEPPEPPTCREMVITDTTQERVAALLAANPRGILLYRDELSGWFASFNQYRPGGDEQFYLQCHAGGPWLQHRIRGDVVIPDVCLSIFGGFQPEVVSAVLARGGHTDKPDNGLTARFSLLVWPDPTPVVWVDNPPDRDLRERINRLFDRLADLDPERLVGPKSTKASHFAPLRFTPDAQAVFRDWFGHHHENQQALDPDAQIKGHFAKYDGLFARLALVHHLLRYTQSEDVEPAAVDAVTATAVLRFIEAYLRPHAQKIYRHLGRDPGYQGALRIARWLVENPTVTSFTARDISRKQWAGLTGRNEATGKDYLRAALYYLDRVAGWVRADEVPAGPRGGRPTVVYVVNPNVPRNS